MEYTALYRKFRPSKFDEIVGQEHIVKTIKNEIIAGRVGHAYLFNGGRGTGKTSAAKILSRAVNCLNPKDGEPCNECEICKAALEGSLTDIVEMDAASNNGVEDIRAIRDEVNFLPTLAKYRVYIIDEVHMLSPGAFNALLKTLEEPPSHVKFILATTEPQKLPATILSRCQRFDFKKISIENIIKRLKIVCGESKIEITPEAMKTIAILAEGAMRDALSILERCAQEDTKITEEIVKDLVGIPHIDSVNKVAKSVLKKDTNSALDAINEIIISGKDIENFLWELIKYIKDVLVYKAKCDLDIYSIAEKDLIKELADSTSKDELTNIIFELSNLANQIKLSAQKNIMFQVTIIKLCNQNYINSDMNNFNRNVEKNGKVSNINTDELEKMKNKIEHLEKELKLIENANTSGSKKDNQSLENNQAKKKEADVKAKNPIEIVVGEKIDAWPKVIGNIKQTGKMAVYVNLMSSVAIQMNDMTVGISFPNGLTQFKRTVLEQNENMSEIIKQVSIELGKPMRVKLLDDNIEVKEKETKFDDISKELDIPINIIEE